MGSEISNVKRSQLFATGASSLVLGTSFLLILYGTMHAVGSDFMYAASYTYGTSGYTLPFAPYYSSFVVLLAQNPLLVTLFAIGFVLGGVWFMVQNVMLTTRITLAWGFDRVFPEAFGRVSQRFKTPLGGRLLLRYRRIGSRRLRLHGLVGLFSQLLAIAIAESLVSIAAIVLPYKHRAMFEASPVAYRVGGVPVLSLLGAGSLVSLLIFIYTNITDSALGSNSTVSLGLIASVYIIGLATFFAALAYRKRQGIDLSAVFKQLPPE